MVFPKIQSPKVTTGTTFGGDVMNLVMQWFSGFNIAATDSTNKPSIATETRFYSGKFILYDYDFTNEIKFFTPQLTNNVSVSLPDNLAISGLNEITFNLVSQTLQNKAIDATVNAITNLKNVNIASDAAIAWSKVSKAGSGLADIASVDLTGLANNVVLRWDSTVSKWVTYPLGSIIGEVNTASNVGTGGVGVYKQKSGVNIELKKINTASSAVTVTDDTANSEIDIGVVDATTSQKGIVTLGTSSDTAASKVVQTNDSRLSDNRAPTNHAVNHKLGGGDSIKLNELAAPTTNITALNTSTTYNGLAPQLHGSSGYYLDGSGAWSIPAAASGLLDTGTLVRGVTNKSGNGSTKVFTIVHGYSGTPVAYLVQPTSVDAFGAYTISVDATNITLTYQVAPPTGTNNLTYSWLVMSSGTGSAAGEANTASTSGSGLSWTQTKVGSNLPFRSFLAGSTKISLTQNTNDITIDVNQGNLAIAWSQITSGIPSALVRTDQANVFAGTNLQTFQSSYLKMMNPAGTFGTTFVNSALAANWNLTFPLLTANDTVAVLALAQTFTNKTLTAPIIDLIKSNGFNFTVPTLTTNDTIMGRNTTDTQTNKTLTLPIIAAIKNGSFSLTIPTLVANDVIAALDANQAFTQKTALLSSNTFTDTGAAAGGIPIHNGTKYTNQPKGAEGTFLGVSGGSVGYFTPATGSGGTLPDGSNIPSTGRWGAMWGGTSTGRGNMHITTSGTVGFAAGTPTESITSVTTAAADDSIAEFRSSDIYARQSNVVFRAKWAAGSTSGCVIMIGLTSLNALPTGGSHDNPLNTASGILITCSQDVESVYQITRNDGTGTNVKVSTSVAANNTTDHTVEINANTTNVTVTLDGGTPVSYTTDIPSLTDGMRIYAHVEAIGGTARTISVKRLQTTSL